MTLNKGFPEDYSGVTDREYFGRWGCLTPERQERLIARLEALEAATVNGVVDVSEAMAQYPAEGFLGDVKSRVAEIAKRTRGKNKEDLESLLEMLNDLEMMTFYAAEYGLSELRKLQNILDRAGVGA